MRRHRQGPRRRVWLLAPALLLLGNDGRTAGGATAATVHVRVVDDATRETVAARAYLWRGGDLLLPSGFPSYERGDERHFLVPGEFVLELEPGKYQLRVDRGLEYLPQEVSFDVPGSEPLVVRMRRWAAMNRDGWYSADMHVHRDPADVPLVLEAEDLNFVPTITTHVWSTQVSQPWKARAGFVQAVGPGRLFTANSQEVERIQGGPGAVILMGRDVPLPFSGYELYPPAAAYARAVHAQDGFVEGDKPFWVDTFVNAVLGHIDAIEVNCNHFLPREVDTDLAPWSHWPIEFGYRGARGFALWMMDLYYRLLNAGVALPLSAGSASGVKATPVGYNRVYVRLGTTPFEYAAFMEALRQGRSFSTNGPLLDVDIDGRYGPGDRIELQPGREYRVRARARSRAVLERLQLIVNGSVVAEERGQQDSRELRLHEALRFDQSAWVAVRAFERAAARETWEAAPQVFAHSSPVYLLRDGRPVAVAESIRDLVGKIDVLIAHTERLEGFKQESDREETIALYRSARDLLVGRASGR